MSGWQASEPTYLRSLSSILRRVHDRFPNGTLWVLNRAKLARYERRSEDAVGIIVEALGREAKEGNSFREADSLLVFEVSQPGAGGPEKTRLTLCLARAAFLAVPLAGLLRRDGRCDGADVHVRRAVDTVRAAELT